MFLFYVRYKSQIKVRTYRATDMHTLPGCLRQSGTIIVLKRACFRSRSKGLDVSQIPPELFTQRKQTQARLASFLHRLGDPCTD